MWSPAAGPPVILQSLSAAAIDATASGPTRVFTKTNKLNIPILQLEQRGAGVYVNLLILSMFACCVTLISEKRHKGHCLVMQTNTPSVNFFGDESLFIAANERHGGQLSLPV